MLSRPGAVTALLIMFCLLTSVFSVACGIGGGSGGGDDQSESETSPAQVQISVAPSLIDSGDRTRVTVRLFEIQDGQGVLLKIQYPEELSVVRDSSVLRLGQESVDINPAVNLVTGNPGEERGYLVYDLPSFSFLERSSAEIIVSFEGRNSTTKGAVIAADADFNDPDISIGRKFSGLQPRFDPASSSSVTVRDASGLITPTVTPTPTATNTPAPTNTPKPTATPRPTRAAA